MTSPPIMRLSLNAREGVSGSGSRVDARPHPGVAAPSADPCGP